MWKFELYKASWLESLEFLKKDLGHILLVSLRSLMSLYRSLVYAWFLPITLLVGLALSIPLLLGAFYSTVLVRAARPSIDYKNSGYWQKLVFVDWIIFFGVLFLVQIPHYITESALPSLLEKILWYTYDVILRLFFLAGQFWLPGAESLGSMMIFLSPFLILVILFMLDAKREIWPNIKAVGRAVLMLAYNYPFFLILYALFRIMLSVGYLLSFPLSWYVPQSAILGWIFFLLVLFPYWICVITNFYVKRLHEQFSFYYWR